MNNPTTPDDATFARLEAIHWYIHAPSTLCLAVPPGFKGMRTTIAECSSYGRDIDLSISDARRLAACWNALAGVPTEQIEHAGAAHAAGPLLLDAILAQRAVLNLGDPSTVAEAERQMTDASRAGDLCIKAIAIARGEAPITPVDPVTFASKRAAHNRRAAAEMRFAAVTAPAGVAAELCSSAAVLERQAQAIELDAGFTTKAAS